MNVSSLITHLMNVKARSGDIQVLLADPKNAIGAHDINRGDIMRTDGKQVLVLVPNVEGLTENSAILAAVGGINGKQN